MSALCEADCAIRGRHRPDCVDDECRGCLPRHAADGLRLCDLHTERIQEDALEAPALYADLSLVLIRTGGNGERTSGTAVSAPVPDEAVLDARGLIRSTLVRLTRLIVEQRGVTPPVARVAGRLFVATTAPALGPFVARHATWLAAHHDAGKHSNDLHVATRGPVRALAYPHGRDRLYVGDCPLLVGDREEVCGTRLYQRADQPLITCVGCGTQDTIEQWQRWIVGGEPEAVSDVYAIATHLSTQWTRPVDPGTLKVWASRGHIRPVTRADPQPGDPDHEGVVRDGRGRAQYPVAEVVAFARSLWGPPARPI